MIAMAKKRTQRNRPARAARATKLAGTKTACRVRMYRQGFGDCFLLGFTTAGKTRFVMIDCGVVTAATEGKAKIKAVIDDVVKETGGRIDLLVVTHEHWDHL